MSRDLLMTESTVMALKMASYSAGLGPNGIVSSVLTTRRFKLTVTVLKVRLLSLRPVVSGPQPEFIGACEFS